ncbi:16164_t:CDS:2, partial [Racocetra persica]
NPSQEDNDDDVTEVKTEKGDAFLMALNAINNCKADLIEHFMIASNLAQSQKNISSSNMEGEVWENMHEEGDTNQENICHSISPAFSVSSKPISDDESRRRKPKRMKRESKDARVEISNIRLELHKNWPDIKFERSRDQFEYNALCAIGNDLDLALSTSTADEAGLETDHTGNKNSIHQKEKEIDCIVPKEKEMIHSRITTMEAWGTTQIIAPQDRIDDHLKKTRVIWDDFIDFCNAYKLVALPASQNSVLAYLIWSDMRGRALKSTLVLTAIANQHSAHNLPDPTKNYKLDCQTSSRRYSSHSLRIGGATTAMKAGLSLPQIMAI